MEILKQRPTVLIRIITHYLESHRRLVVPQLGAFVVKEPEGVVLFSELLKRDDGVLRGLLRASGQSELEAAGEIDRFVFEVRHAVQEGGEYALAGLGRLKPGPNGTIAFAYDPTTAAPDAGAEGPEQSEETVKAGEAGDAVVDAATPSAPSATSAASAAADSAHFGNPGGSTDSAASAHSLHSANAANAVDSAEPSGSAVGSPHAGRLSDAHSLYEAAPAATPSHATPSAPAGGPTPHNAKGRGVPPRMQADQLARSVERVYSEAFVSESATKNPDPSVRGLRYGKAPKKPKTDDAYTYMTRQRRRGDLFLWIAILAALIASAAIGFGYWREHRERQAEAEYLEYRQLIDGTAPAGPTSGTSDSDAAPNPTTSDEEAAPTDAADAAEGEE